MAKDLGIDRVGPKVHDTGPYDEGKVDPGDVRECEGCGRERYATEGHEIGHYGWWCNVCLNERLKVE